MNSLLSEWLSEHLTVSESIPWRKSTRRIRRLAHLVDLSALPKRFRYDLAQEIISQFRVDMRSKKKSFSWWIIPSSLGTAFYR